MHGLFAYGTLRVPSIVQAVLGYVPASKRGVLHDHFRGTIQDKVYPGITPRLGERVSGLVYDLQSPKDLRLLDDYEGSLYERFVVTVATERTTLDVLAYIVRPSRLGELTEEAWSLPHFLREHAHRFRTAWS
jgi:gamma-glutamylcyclotransferase (GGCT)/AIG2-like uncharacterized protein YtfP